MVHLQAYLIERIRLPDDVADWQPAMEKGVAVFCHLLFVMCKGNVQLAEGCCQSVGIGRLVGTIELLVNEELLLCLRKN